MVTQLVVTQLVVTQLVVVDIDVYGEKKRLLHTVTSIITLTGSKKVCKLLSTNPPIFFRDFLKNL